MNKFVPVFTMRKAAVANAKNEVRRMIIRIHEKDYRYSGGLSDLAERLSGCFRSCSYNLIVNFERTMRIKGKRLGCR